MGFKTHSILYPQVSLFPIERYASLLGQERMQEVAIRVAELRARLADRAIWNLSSTSAGGGVAEMVRSLLAYARGAGVDARWAIVHGSPEFFRVTKRLHNAIHGNAGDGTPLGEAEQGIYQQISAQNASEFAPLVGPNDVVIVHDPQPAGMIPALVERGAHIIWRCHIGSDHSNDETERGWSFLKPHVERASAYVFTRPRYVPPRLDATRAVIIPPTIDPYSPKNQPMQEKTIRSILTRTGILEGPTNESAPTFMREDGTPGRVDRFADALRHGKPPSLEAPLVVQVSRWDRLKDPVGVLRGFASSAGLAERGAHLILAGPSTRAVADDPEDVKVYQEVVDAWRQLPDEPHARIHLVSVPIVDIDENAAIINALQRHASIVVQKSLHEGFGLTVTEALWKDRPVVASAVGGIQDQIVDGVHGLLLRDPRDLEAFARSLERLLGDSELSRRLGQNGHARVIERYLGINALLHYGALIEKLDCSRADWRRIAG